MSISSSDVNNLLQHNGNTTASLIDESMIDSTIVNTSENKNLINKLFNNLADFYRTTWRNHVLLSWLYRSPKRHASTHEYHLAHLAPSIDTTSRAQYRALQLLALANHFYLLPSIGYLCANLMYYFVELDINNTYVEYNDTILLYSSIVTFIMSCIFFIDSILYYMVIIVQRQAASHNDTDKKYWYNRFTPTMTWELFAEILNIIACIFYVISGILGLPVAVTQINNLHLSIDIDRVANVCDDTAMFIFVIDSFIYLYIWSAYQPSYARWYRTNDRDADWWAQAYNMFGSIAYLIAVIYGAVKLSSIDTSDTTINWELQIKLNESQQQFGEIIGDILYCIGAMYQERAYYNEIKRVQSVGLASSNYIDTPVHQIIDNVHDTKLPIV